MSGDPYSILGVKWDASQEEIQKTYRRLAKKLHPDLNPGDDKAEEQFKEVTQAYSLLSDPAKRKRFDEGEIDEQGAERPRQRYYRDFADSDLNQYANGAGFSDLEGAEDILSGIFERGGAGERAAFKMRGANVQYLINIDFLDAVNGAQRQIHLPDGSPLDIAIPPGVREGQVLRLPGKGRPGYNGGPAGDALIEIAIKPHHFFTREGDDIHVELPISLREAVLGGQIRVPTTTGKVEMKLPPWSNSGAVLRLKGRAPGKDRRARRRIRQTQNRSSRPARCGARNLPFAMAARGRRQCARDDGGVTMDLRKTLENSGLEVASVEVWVEAGWIAPAKGAGAQFSEVDLARARLIHDLRHGLGVNDEGIPIILDLIDQLHGLRRAMRVALAKQPNPGSRKGL